MENYSVSSEPELIYKLLPGEQIVDVVEHTPRLFEKIPSSKEQLLRLTHARHTEEIGKYGPSLASLAFEVSARTSVPTGESPLHTLDSELPAPEHLRLYEAVFGRDSLRVAIDLITSYPELARGTTLRLAELQGVSYSVDREEEPGRIVHEARVETDPVARELSQRLGWGWPYYGSVDATPEFIRTLTAYCRRTEENNAFLSQEYFDRAGIKRSMAYALDMAVEWIEQRLDSTSEGVLEYHLRPPTNSANREWTDVWNQVWKDSWDAYHHADGTIANHDQGIASLEVQVTAFDALIDAAQLYENILDDNVKATALRNCATSLKQAILTIFWTEDKGGYFVLGTDRDAAGQLRQMKIRTSNMGHVLNSRLLEDDDPEIVRKRSITMDHLLSPEMLNVSGIRTLASDEVRFRPGAYHNGSVWLWDTHHIAKGFRRHGFNDVANDLDCRMLNIIEITKIFPEYVRGDDSDTPSINHRTIRLWDQVNQRYNKIEQPPQEVQAWTVAAILAIKKRMARHGMFID
jgi:glycogen debranching enzyme